MSKRDVDQKVDAFASGFVLHLDGARCDGHGICVLRFPQRISLDEWGYAVIDARPIAAGLDLDRARRAVRACPEGALELSAIAHEPPLLRLLGSHLSQVNNKN
jgi:ferredoxin